MVQVLVTRTAPGAYKTAERLKGLGFDPVLAITAEVRPRDVAWPEEVEAIAVTSPNGARRAVELSPTVRLPVYAVGDATASVMREAGFKDVTSAHGDGATLARAILDESVNRRFVHVRGAEQAFDLVAALKAGGTGAEPLIAYAAERVNALPSDALDAIKPGAIVLIHSANGAERFLSLAGGSEALSGLRVFAISAEAAAPLMDAPLNRIDIASAPTEDALIAALVANPA